MNRERLDILVVAGEPCWPAVNGGRVRTGALALALAREFDVAVASPPDPFEMRAGAPLLPWIELPPREAPSLRHRIGLRPRLGCAVLGNAGSTMLAEIIAQRKPRVVLYAMSYLAAVGMRQRTATVVVDFANIEVERLGSFARSGPLHRRASALSESLKARLWEPVVARTAHLTVAVSHANAATLSEWGAEVVVVPNAVDPIHDAVESAPRGPAVFIASFGYAPNSEAAHAVLRHVWPRVRARVPDARLVLAGRDSERLFGWARHTPGVTVSGELPTTSPLLAEAAVVLAPVTRGGGTQLKVTHALGARRVVVATPHSARSVPAELAAGCVVASDWKSYADAVASLLTNDVRRHSLEAALRRAHVIDWDEAVAPLVARLRPLVQRDGSAASATFATEASQ